MFTYSINWPWIFCYPCWVLPSLPFKIQLSPGPISSSRVPGPFLQRSFLTESFYNSSQFSLFFHWHCFCLQPPVSYLHILTFTPRSMVNRVVTCYKSSFPHSYNKFILILLSFILYLYNSSTVLPYHPDIFPRFRSRKYRWVVPISYSIVLYCSTSIHKSPNFYWPPSCRFSQVSPKEILCPDLYPLLPFLLIPNRDVGKDTINYTLIYTHTHNGTILKFVPFVSVLHF